MTQAFVVVFAILTLSLSQTITPQESIDICSDLQNGFNRFKAAYNKQYENSQAEEDAQAAYQECCASVLAAAADPSRSFTSSLHSKCDVSLSSFTSSSLYFPPGTGLTPPSTPIVGASSLLGTSCPPNYKDKTTPPKDQGSCGACWAFSTTAAYETHWNMLHSEILNLSEQYVLECTVPYNTSATPHSSCAGGIIDYALTMIVNSGLPLESTYPYAGSSFGGSGTPSTISSCSSNSGFTNLRFPANNSNALWYRYDNVTPSQIQTLLGRGSLVVAIYAEASLYAYSSGVYSCPVGFSTAFSSINHAVELVGMDCNGNYIIKNSWGTSWGQGGYATISSSSDCAISAYVYQILWGSFFSYPFLLLLLLVLLAF